MSVETGQSLDKQKVIIGDNITRTRCDIPVNSIKRIVLRSTSGYGTLESAYHDELVIERNCISYKYESLLKKVLFGIDMN